MTKSSLEKDLDCLSQILTEKVNLLVEKPMTLNALFLNGDMETIRFYQKKACEYAAEFVVVNLPQFYPNTIIVYYLFNNKFLVKVKSDSYEENNVHYIAKTTM